MIGRTLGNYRIVEQIGMGGMATVYKAYDPDTDRYVAIKVLPQHFSQDPTFRQRFQREAKAIAKLEHIHILPIFAYGEDDGTAYMVMRYLQTGTLTDRIQQGPLPLNEASRLLSQIASALDHAHAHNVLHRDVKPSNVLLDAGGNAFLTDFGIAKMVEVTLDLTGGGILGTPAYMSPEQCQGNVKLTPASDQYSLGIVLYEMVTGRTPFRAETPIALIHMQLNDPLPLPRRLRPDLPEDAERAILKALSKEPGSRYQSCGAMASSFAQAVAQVAAGPPKPVAGVSTLPAGAVSAPTVPPADEPTMPHAPAGPTAMPRPRRSLPWWALVLAGLLVVMALGVGALAVGLFSSEEESAQPEDEVGQVAEVAGPAEETQEPPVEREEVHSIGEPPARAMVVKPCDWDGLGPGLCITPLEGGRLRKILTNAEVEISSSASWSPDGQQIAFSAVEPGENHGRDQTIRIVNADGAGLVELPQFNNDVGPVWSPNGEWLAFHSSGHLALMHPDGSEPTLLWEAKENQCAIDPQWSPDGQAIVVSILPRGCRWSLPMTRQIWVITDEGDTIIPVATVTHENKDCTQPEVAFSPEAEQVAYFDGNCRPWLANADGSGQAAPLDDFPYWWTGMIHPQWGLEMLSEGEGIFYEDFAGGPLNRDRWEAQDGARDADLVFIEDRQLWITVDNNRSQPWDMLLAAKLLAPVNRVEFELGLEKAKGDAFGFGVVFNSETNIWLNKDGAVLAKENGQVRELRPAARLPVHYRILFEWQEGELVVYVDEEPVGSVPVDDLARTVEFVAHVEPGGELVGYLDEVRLTYAPPEEPSPPAAEPLAEARIVELCERTKPPQICVRDASSDGVLQIIGDLEFEAIYRLAWSSDGEQIVFDAGSADETKIYDHKLYLINADGSGLRQITYGEDNDIDPAWSPDGEWIAFHRSCQLWMLAAHSDAPGERRLLENREDFCASRPVWSPDSRRIAFVNHPGQGFPVQIQTITPDGAEQQLIFTFEPPVDWAELAWNPDGRQLACWYGAGDEVRAFLLNADGSGKPKPIDPDDELPRRWRAEFWTKTPGREVGQDSQEDRCGPEEKVLFVDDFEDGQAEGWNFLSEAGVQQGPWPVGVDEGNHFLVGTGHNWAQTGPDSWTNYSLHVRFRHVTADSDAHLNIRVGDGRYHVHLRGGLLKRDFTPKGEREVILAQWDYRPDREWHEFTLSAVGGRIEAYLDGELVGAYDDPDPLPPGRIGLENLAGTTWYDEVVVCGGY